MNECEAMKNFRYMAVLSFIALLWLISCSGRDNRVRPEEFLPESISSLGMERSADVLVFRGDSLSHYTRDAPFYERFNFVDLATCDYSADNIVLEVEIFRLAAPKDAYGLYSHMRWGNSDKVVPLGIEGFKSPPDIVFVRGPYVVHVMGFDDSEAPMKALDDLAAYFASDVPGVNQMPPPFAIFPSEGRVPASAIYFPDMFLGLDFMKCIYACYHEIDADTVFLFMACDSAGPMLLQWNRVSEADSTYHPAPEDLPFDEGRGFMIEHARFGRVLMGMKNDIMVGLLGYDDRYRQFMTDWINSLPENTVR